MSFFGRIAARAGAPSVPRTARAVPKGIAARASLRRQEMPEEEEMQTLRRQQMPQEKEMQRMRRREEAQPLRRQKEEEEEAQPLRRQEEEEEPLQSVRRQEMPDEKEMQMLRRQEEEEEELRTLRRQEEEEEMQTLRRLDEEPEEEMQALRRQEEEEEMQSLRRLDEEPEEEMQALRRQEEEEEIEPLRRQAEPPDAASIDPETSPKPPSFSALPDEPREMRGLRRDVAAGAAGATQGAPQAGVPGAEVGGEGDAGPLAAPPPFWPAEPGLAFDPGFAPERRPPAEPRPRVVIEHMDVVISEPAGAAAVARGSPDLGRRLKSRYLRGL